MPTLDSARMKLERAEELINAIRAEYDSLNAAPEPVRDLCTTETEIAADGVWYIMRCAKDVPLPTRWALLAGDAVHNTRAALDHLACRLVELAGNQITRNTAFPIRTNEPRTPSAIQAFNRQVAGMDQSHQDSIWRLQPYAMRGTAEAAKLVTLSALDNLDKHTLLMPQMVVLSPSAGKRTPQFTSLEPDQIDFRWNVGALVAPGVEILRYRPRSGVHTVVQVDFPVPARATYGNPSTGLRELRDIRSYVVGIVESFAPEFR
jgi:hypothetical protein